MPPQFSLAVALFRTLPEGCYDVHTKIPRGGNRAAFSPLRSARRPAVIVALLTLLIPIVGITESAYALDATRALTQAFHRVWQVPQGLPDPKVFVVSQTSDGYLWLGSPAGLIRFDGLRFTTIRECAGVRPEDLWVHDLCEDQAHNLWIATDRQGLIRYRGATPRRFTVADGLPSDTVQCVIADKRGAVWAGTSAGVVRLTDSRVAAFGRDQGLPLIDIHAMAEAQDGSIWAGGEGNRLGIFDGKAWTTRELVSMPSAGTVRAIVPAEDGTVWVGTSIGLIQYKDGKDNRLTTTSSLADDSILCLTAARDGSLWAGTKDGFSRLRDGECESLTAADGLSQSTVYSLCEDREGSLWVGTKHGLNQFSDRRTLPFTVREGLPSNEVGPICQDAESNIWVGTLGAGLARFDGRRFVTLTTSDGLASDAVYALAADNDGQLWIGTDRGLNSMRNCQIEKKYTIEDGLPANLVTCLCQGSRGCLWIGTSAGIAKLHDGRIVQPPGSADDLAAPVRAVLERRDGTLIAATSGGLYCYADEQYRRFPSAALANRDVDTLFEDADGRLWIGTEADGLLLLEGEKVVNFTTKTGLYDDDISGLVVDDEDRLWMASSSGISYVPRADLLKFAEGNLAKLTSTPFRMTDAMRTFEAREGIQASMCKTRDGRIWVSTTLGLLAIDPARLVRVLPPAPVVVEEVVVNGQIRSPQEIATLPPGSSNVAFEYTALSLLTPMRITFRYKLEGFDNDWIDAGARREAFYTNLGPGNYRFRVIARKSDNSDWDQGEPVAFTIEPHFYQTSWFLPLVGLTLGLTGLGVYRLRVRRIKEQMRAVVAERSRIARELHDTLIQGFSGVTMEMQALAARLSPSNERGTLDEIIHDAASCLRDARRSVAGLRSGPGDRSGLAGAIAQAARQLTETRDVRLRLELSNSPRQLPVEVEYNLLRIAQEAITNAVKHASARTIDVSLACTSQQILLTIADDGVGFAISDGPWARPGHYGLIGMKERATQIGAEFRIAGEAGAGTAVSVRLPLSDSVHGVSGTSRHPVTREA
jgi:signal transduction histidine kinase/ligand-binding sensor domain-containing protein